MRKWTFARLMVLGSDCETAGSRSQSSIKSSEEYQPLMTSAERRLSKRVPVRADVDVWFGGQRLGRWRLRNVGWSGAFIEAGPVDLYLNDCVELSFAAGQQRELRLAATVVRRASDGVGLMFTHPDPGAIDTLLKQGGRGDPTITSLSRSG